MDVALDTNVFYRDPWLRSQAFRLLLDYVHKTQSRFLLSDVVVQEIDAIVRRNLRHDLYGIEKSLKDAQRHGIADLPIFESMQIEETTYKRWRENFDAVLGRLVAVRFPVDEKCLPEAVRRAINRVPPCKDTGEGMRDAIIWLNLLGYCQKRLGTYRDY